jgi:hypothetical protein
MGMQMEEPWMNDSDTSEKRDDLGIEQPGQMLATALVDELEEQRLRRKIPREERPYVCISWRPERPDGEIRKRFATLSELLAYVGSKEMRRRQAGLFKMGRGGYTIGHLYWDEDGAGILNWREPIPLDEPLTYCDKCGSDDVRDGRCQTCGSSDRIVTIWYTWEENRWVL